MPIVQSVTLKRGVSQKTRKPWIRYDIELDDGRVASGFNFVKVGDTVNVVQEGQYLNFTLTAQNGTQSSQDARQRVDEVRAKGEYGRGSGTMSREDYWARKEDYDREREARFVANQPRIERQHSQEMMLRYFTLRSHLLDKCTSPEEAQTLMREVTDHFQKDIGRSPERKTESVPEDDPYLAGAPDDEPPF